MMPKSSDQKPTEPLSEMAIKAVGDSFGITRRQTKSWGKKAVRVLKIVGLMLLAAIVIPVTMISLGLLLGPKGYEGFIITPLAVLFTWGLILFFGTRRRATPRKIAKANLAQLPSQIVELLDTHRRQLPSMATPALDSIIQHLEDIEPAVALLASDTAPAQKLRKLLAEDLTGLVDHYRRLPPRLRTKKLHGGPSPEEQFIKGATTIEQELGRTHDELAQDDLYSLATKQRYLEIKYQQGNGGSTDN